MEKGEEVREEEAARTGGTVCRRWVKLSGFYLEQNVFVLLKN